MNKQKIIPKSEKRTFEQLREHYSIEKELADRLRNSSKKERRYLYISLYDELFIRVPDHPQLTQKRDSESRQLEIHRCMRFLKRFLTHKSTFLEVGPGDCGLSLEVTKHVKKVYAIDVSREITKNKLFPQNFKLIISDGSNIPVPEKSISVAYSSCLMEHLHPDDAFNQLNNIYRALTPNGKYICITPNRLSGPHDISMYFDEIARGFHLKEYTTIELYNLFLEVGFSKIQVYIGGKGIYIRFPLSIIKLYEKVLNIFPFSLRKNIVSILPFRILLGITMIGIKSKN